MTVPLSDLWCRALADLDSDEQDLRVVMQNNPHPGIIRNLERRITERKGIVNAIDWICRHEDLVADVMAAEKRKKATQ